MPLAGQFAERLIDSQIDAFAQVQREWVQQIKSDPQLEGSE